MPSVRTIDDIDVAGKRVLVRVDFNVPMKDGKVTDTTRIDRTVPSLKELAGQGREGDRPQPPRPAERQEKPGIHAEAGGRRARRGARQAGGVRAGLHRSGSEEGGGRAEARRVRHAGKRPLLPRGREERRRSSRRSWRSWATCWSPTHSPRRTARMPRWRRWRG